MGSKPLHSRRYIGLQPALCLTFGMLLGSSALAQERWFQVEVSIFSNENPADRNEETWSAAGAPLAYPDNIRRFEHLLDLLLIDELVIPEPRAEALVPEPVPLDGLTELPPEPDPNQLRLQQTGPFPFVADPGFRFYDLDRDPFILLPDDFSDFQQTNRALERSAEHRVLFTGRWRQPVLLPARARPLYIEGGVNYGEFHELQGTITIRFNDNQDRVVIDANLWLLEPGFGFEEGAVIDLPDSDLSYPSVTPSTTLLPGESVQRVYRFIQSREMRSTEFHYLDHPALGIIIQVEPYEVPPPPIPGINPFAPPIGC